MRQYTRTYVRRRFLVEPFPRHARCLVAASSSDL